MNTFLIKLTDYIRFFSFKDPYIIYKYSGKTYIGYIDHDFDYSSDFIKYIFPDIPNPPQNDRIHFRVSVKIIERSYNLEYLTKKYFLELL